LHYVQPTSELETHERAKSVSLIQKGKLQRI
jgi:hypothetical protein